MTPAYAVVVACLFGLLWLVSVLQIVKTIYYGHRIASFQMGFMTLCCGWSFLRMFLFGVPVELSEMALLYIYWLPTVFQFATFTLVLVYYCFVVYESNWREKQNRVYLIYIVNNGFLLMTTVGGLFMWCVLLGDCEKAGNRPDSAPPENEAGAHLGYGLNLGTSERDNGNRSTVEATFHVILGIEYLALSICHVYYCRRLWRKKQENTTSEDQRKLTLTYTMTDSLPSTPVLQQRKTNEAVTGLYVELPLSKRGSSESLIKVESVDIRNVNRINNSFGTRGNSCYSPVKYNREGGNADLAGLGRTDNILQNGWVLLFTSLIYISRCVYYFLSAFDLWDLEITQDDKTFMKTMEPQVFVLFVLWEVLPTCVVLYCFRHIQPTNLRCPLCCKQPGIQMSLNDRLRNSQENSVVHSRLDGSPDSSTSQFYNDFSDANGNDGLYQITTNSPIASSVLGPWHEQKSRSALRAQLNQGTGYTAVALPPKKESWPYQPPAVPAPDNTSPHRSPSRPRRSKAKPPKLGLSSSAASSQGGLLRPAGGPQPVPPSPQQLRIQQKHEQRNTNELV